MGRSAQVFVVEGIGARCVYYLLRAEDWTVGRPTCYDPLERNASSSIFEPHLGAQRARAKQVSHAEEVLR